MIFEINFKNFAKSVPEVLRKAGLAEKIKKEKRIVLKPNLTLNKKPPTTTPVELIAKVVEFCQKESKAKIIIAEGAGGCPTKKSFADLGYTKMAQEKKVELLDLNKTKRVTLKNNKALIFKKIKLPQVLLNAFLINLPVLKEHNEAKLTCAMKNLIGTYQNKAIFLSRAPWSKMDLHRKGLNESIWDLNLYLKSDFVLVDASIGQKGGEINGQPCYPPIGRLVAGFDALETDIRAAKLLGLEKEEIPYLNF